MNQQPSDRPSPFERETVGPEEVAEAIVEGRPAHQSTETYDLDPDVEQIHRALLREPLDPEEGREQAPWWLWVTIVLALFWGGFYLGRFGGDFSAATHIAYRGQDNFVAQEESQDQAVAITDPIAAGQSIYTQRCQSCHQQNGLGLENVFPPIIGSEWVVGPDKTVVRILLNGLQGPVEVAGKTYNGAMPPWRDTLSDQEIAAVATFIRQWEANDAEPVPPELVAELRPEGQQRGTPWTAEELRAAEE